MRNKYLRFADVLFLLSFVAGTTMMACSEQPHQPTLKATYNKPAKNWESEALPIGNGYMGAMIFGDVYVDVIQTNEHTLWSGGPVKSVLQWRTSESSGSEQGLSPQSAGDVATEDERLYRRPFCIYR